MIHGWNYFTIFILIIDKIFNFIYIYISIYNEIF